MPAMGRRPSEAAEGTAEDPRRGQPGEPRSEPGADETITRSW
jgi:hypothetical protein